MTWRTSHDWLPVVLSSKPRAPARSDRAQLSVAPPAYTHVYTHVYTHAYTHTYTHVYPSMSWVTRAALPPALPCLAPPCPAVPVPRLTPPYPAVPVPCRAMPCHAPPPCMPCLPVRENTGMPAYSPAFPPSRLPACTAVRFAEPALRRRRWPRRRGRLRRWTQ